MKTVVWFWLVLGALSATGTVIVKNLGETARFTCGARDPEWHHGDKVIVKYMPRMRIPIKGQGYIEGRTRASGTTLQVSKVTEEDGGRYTCIADGRSEEFTLLVVSVSASPSGDLQPGSDATLQCTVAGLDSGPAVRWTGPDGGVHSGSQMVQLKPVASSDAGTWECSFSHAGETYKNSLEIKLKEPVIPTAARIPPPKPGVNPQTNKPNSPPGVTHPPSDVPLLLGLSWWVWAAAGVGGLVVLLLVVLVCLLCKRLRRRKRKMRKMKLAKQKPFCQCNRPTAAVKPQQQGRRREKPSGLSMQPLLKE